MITIVPYDVGGTVAPVRAKRSFVGLRIVE